MSKKNKIRIILGLLVLILVLLTSAVYAALGIGNDFSIENGIASTLENVAGIVKGKFIEQYTEDKFEFEGYKKENETTSSHQYVSIDIYNYINDLSDCTGYPCNCGGPELAQAQSDLADKQSELSTKQTAVNNAETAMNTAETEYDAALEAYNSETDPVEKDNKRLIYIEKLGNYNIYRTQYLNSITDYEKCVDEVTVLQNKVNAFGEKVTRHTAAWNYISSCGVPISWTGNITSTLNQISDYLNGPNITFNPMYTSAESITTLMDFLNDKTPTHDPTGVYRLYHDPYFYCLKLGQPLGRYNAYISKIDGTGSFNVRELFTDPTYPPKNAPYQTPAKEGPSDHFELSEKNPYGNVSSNKGHYTVSGGAVSGITSSVSGISVDLETHTSETSSTLPGVFDSIGATDPTWHPSTKPSGPQKNRYDVRAKKNGSSYRKVTVTSNARYFYIDDYGVKCDENTTIPLYETRNDGLGMPQGEDTNVFAYALAFSKKLEYADGEPYGPRYWERAQGAIWTNVGNYPDGKIFTDDRTHGSDNPNQSGNPAAEELSDTGDESEMVHSVNTEDFDPDDSCLFNAGKAIDKYEEAITNQPGKAGHEMAVKSVTEGHNPAINYNVIVSTKPKGSVSFNGMNHTVAEDYTEADNGNPGEAGTIKDATGTILVDDGATYKVGPFVMDDYIYAASEHVGEFSGKNHDGSDRIYPNLIGGIISGEITLTDDSGTEFTLEIGNDKDVKISYTSAKGTDEVKGNDSLTDPDNYLYKIEEDDYEFPRPQSVFFIDIPRSVAGDATMLEKIKFVYRQTYTDGDGWVIVSRYIKSTWTATGNGSGSGCGSYSCANEPGGRKCTAPSPHTFGKCLGGKILTDTTHNDQCGITCHCSSCKCDPCKCKKHTWTCNRYTYCQHGFRDCESTSNYKAENGQGTVMKGQPFLVVHKAVVGLEDYVYEAEVNVRLTTDLTINKYIYDVEHTPEEDVYKESDYNSTYPEAIMEEYGKNYSDVSREQISENTKSNNPVYVEYGDIVTYHIQLINKQKKDVTVKIYDVLPENAILLSVQNITQKLKDESVTDDTGKVLDFKPQNQIADGSESSLDVLMKTPQTKVETTEPVDEKLSAEQYFTTDWIGVPGSADGNNPNIVTIAVRIKVIDWENTRKWENKVRIITRNSGPKSSPGSDDYVEDYMRVVDNGKKLSELPGERDTWGTFSKYPANTRFPLELLTKVTPDDRVVDGPVVNIAELDPKVDDKDGTLPDVEKLQSSDWYILNNYNAFIDKHVYQYDEKIQQNNEDLNYTEAGYVAYHNGRAPGEDPDKFYIRKESDEDKKDVLLLSRANLLAKRTDDFEDKADDGNLTDKVRPPHAEDSDKETRSNEKYKKAHPVSVEKTEQITYAIKVLNDANIIENTGHISGSKPATQVRTTKITDYLEKGLKRVDTEVEAYIYDEDDNLVKKYSAASTGKVTVTESEDGEYSADGRTFQKYEYEIEDDTILNPGDYIVYFVTVEVVESNMYLYDLENRATITVLTNINKDTNDDSRIVRNKNGVEGTDTDRNENISLQDVSSDFVRLKDLVIAGRVWVDFNRDGYMNEDVEKTFTEECLDPGGIKGNGAEIKDKITQYYSVDKYGRKQGVDVKLYKVEGNTAKWLRTTQTDETGLYTFATKTGGDNNLVNRDAMEYYDDYNYDVMPDGSKIVDFQKDFEWYQRVDKANEKDEDGNYTDNSNYIDYYIEFEYDGVVYRSTEFYSGEDNINFEEGDNFGRYDEDNPSPDKAARENQIHKDDGTKGDDYTYKYEVDSNAAEFVDKRQEFNNKFEYVSYNITYENNDDASSKGTGTKSDLEFDKTGHTSQLLEEKDKTKDRKKMTARSFINNATMAGKHGNEKLPADPNEKKWYEEKYTNEGTIKETADLLWLCKYGESEQEYKADPETEYLKHVNLGLELREDVDVDLTKDVYQVKTTVNGEEMVYTYNQNYDREGISNGILNGDRGDTGDTKSEQGSKAYLNDYIVKRPYGLELYESDYKYRYDQYKAEAVRNYKEDKSELDIEVTYRITISNKSVWDDETLLSSTKPSEKTRKDKDGKEKPEIKDTKLDVKVHEVMDFYDKNFIEYKGDPTQKIISKTKDKDGYLIDKDIIVAEAWYYRKANSKDEKGDDNLTYYIENVNGRGDNAIEKPVYKAIENDEEINGVDTFYVRKNLALTNSSGYSERAFAKDPKDAGYYKTYISGMDKDEDSRKYFRIPEGEDRDIYVKYVIDKHDGAFNETTNESVYSETSSSIKTITKDGLFEGTHVETASVTKTTINRALRIAEQIANKPNPRGTENIAQLNAYSVWYNGTERKASLVDKDSNVGNVGIKNTGTGSVPNPTDEITVDDEEGVPYYEDTVYKTGIEIIANGTENTEEKMSYKGGDIVFRISDDPIIRSISGMVWDDSRSVELTSDKIDKDQYIGNGIYNEGDKPNEDAKINDNVKVNYKGEDVTEEKDIKVRNANAEFVEIVEIPPKKGENTNNSDEPHYYEEILANVTWDQTQHIRTDEDGNYTLKGFMPGKYIVRFTYGDNVEGNTEATKDMRVFNGQDYKTTQYAYEMSDYANSSKGTNSTENLADLATENNTIDEYATANTESERGKLETNSIDTVLTALERPNLSDARDDEIRRLAVNNYSEIMINKKAEVLKGLANGTELTNKKVDSNGVTAEVNYYNPKQEGYEGSRENTEEQLKELNDNTFMHAETVEFLVKSEKLTYPQTTGTYYGKYIGGEENAMKVYYDLLRNIEFNTVANRNFKIENIDMGIEYRPETAIGLTKEINRIQLITSDNETLMDLQLKTEYGEKGEIIRHYIDTKNSIGSELVQFITNDYVENDLLQGIIQVDDEDIQGFIYLNVDEDILQGCKVVVQYKFVAQNNSEIDRIANTLDEIRFYGNEKTKELRNIYSGKEKTFYLNVEKDLGDLSVAVTTVSATATPTGTTATTTDATKETTEYTANNFARNIVSTDVYSNDEIKGDLYRDRAKTMIDDKSNVAPASSSGASGTTTPSLSTATSPDSKAPALSEDPDGTNGYFGKYVGYTYFVGGDSTDDKQQKEKKSKQDNELDVIAELKFDRVIDYVDTDLEYGQLDQKDISKLANNTPVASTEEDRSKFDTLQGLKNALLNEPINSDIRAVSNQAFSNISLRTALDYSNIIRRVNDQLKFATTTTVTNETELENVLTNLDEVKYKTIVVTVPDRQFDPNRKSEENEDTVINEAFSKYLKPSVLDTGEEINSIAEIVLPVSKVLATETDMENMQYENIAEVVQFTVLTGRRTNFDTTIGNADIHYVDKEFKAQKKEYQPIGSIEFVTSLLEPDTSSTETITLTPPTGLMRNRRVIREAVDTTTNVIEIAVIAIAVVVTILIITKITLVKVKKKRYK